MVASLKPTLAFFLRPIDILRDYSPANLRADLTAGLTVTVILLPQAIAYALIVELPPERGLYSAIIAAIVAALWGSSNQMTSGPINAMSLLVLSVLLSTGIFPGAPEFLPAVGMMAVMVGVFQVVMGIARLGILVNFVSDSVIVGFTAGAGLLIIVDQLRYFLGVSYPNSPDLQQTLQYLIASLPETHWLTVGIGSLTIALIMLFKKLTPRVPGMLIGMVVTSTMVGLFNLQTYGLQVIGRLPRSLPPLAQLPLFDLELIGRLSTGSLAVAAIGLVASMSIARSISSQTGQRLDSNQEFVGQGLANILCGFFSGYTSSGSFTRSALNFSAGARTPIASVLAGVFVFLAMFVLAPLAAFIPRAAMAGALIITGYQMIDRREIVRIWRGTRSDALIMAATLIGILFLDLAFAVLVGILISLATYIVKTSVPEVQTVLPDDNFIHLKPRPDKPNCPQLGIIDILGDLYFGAVNHVEEKIRQNWLENPRQRLLLLRMRSVQNCDISGIHMLEAVMRMYRDQGGDLYLMRVQEPVRLFMRSTGFEGQLGADHFLPEDDAVTFLFHKVIDPAVCIYECEVRAFYECQNLPKRIYPQSELLQTSMPAEPVKEISSQALWEQIRRDPDQIRIIDVREPREFQWGHIPGAELIPMLQILSGEAEIAADEPVVLVCRSGRRSIRAATVLQQRGLNNISILQGGLLAWEAAALLEAVD